MDNPIMSASHLGVLFPFFLSCDVVIFGQGVVVYIAHDNLKVGSHLSPWVNDELDIWLPA